jgi:hypothetical protein
MNARNYNERISLLNGAPSGNRKGSGSGGSM